MVDEPTTNQDGVTPTPEVTETPKTFTKEEVEKQVRDARSAALADIGRLRKESETAMKAAQKAQERIDNLLKEQEAAELAAAEGNPEQLSAVQERQKRRRTEAELAKVQTELDTHKTRLQEIESEKETIKTDQMIREIADKQNVSYDRLASLAKRFKEVTPEAIEDLAQDLPKKQPPTSIKTDSNTSSSGKHSDATQVRNDYIAGKLSSVEYERKMRELGKEP